MQAQGDPNIVVSESAVVKLAGHLQEIGRMRGGINDVRRVLNHAVVQSWAKAQSYRDEAGPVWIIDVSESFEDQMLYAVVRPSLGGNRTVQAVVDVDEVEGFIQSREWKTPEAKGVESQDPVGAESPTPRSSLAGDRAIAQETRLDSDPCLVIWWHTAHADDHQEGAYGTAVMEQVTREEVPGVISRLLQEGVEQKRIEIWTKMSKPKVQIAF